MHHFKYAFKTLLKKKSLIFWTYAFPLILATFFYMAFSNIEKSEKLEKIDIAIVQNNYFYQEKVLQESIQILNDKNSKQSIFNIDYVDLKEAKQLLKEDKITGYLLLTKEKSNIVIKKNGMNETIFKSVFEEIIQTNYLIKDNIRSNSNFNDEKQIKNTIDKIMDNSTTYLLDNSSANLSYTMIEFYTLIAMTCLYGGILGMSSINQILANMSSNGKRTSLAPQNKAKMILGSVAASYLTQLIGLLLLFFYTIFILKIDYGNQLFYIILLTLVGSLAGLTFGIMLASIFKTNENMKTGMIISFTMMGCFLSGMMGITMKYVIDKNIPFLNQINPANMITDGFYALYYYGLGNRYYFNLFSLLIFSSIMIIISYLSLRRQKYDSI